MIPGRSPEGTLRPELGTNVVPRPTCLGNARRTVGENYPQAIYQPVASRLLGGDSGVVFVFSSYSLGVLLVFSWCFPRILRWSFRSVTASPSSACLSLTSLVEPLFKQNRGRKAWSGSRVGAGLANSGLLTAFFRGENPRAMSRPRRMTVLLAAIACLGVPRPPGGFAQPA